MRRSRAPRLGFVGRRFFGTCAAAVASVLYWPMGMAVAGAYRSLNPIRVVLAMGRSLPIYALVLAWLVPVAALTRAAAFGLNVLLMETALALPEAWHAWLAVGLPVAAVLISGGVVQYPAVALFAMLGLILKKYRSRLAWEPREINPWIPFALKALVVVGFTAAMIGLISKIPAWLSQVGSAVTQKSHPPFVPWSAAEQAALQQLESKGASITRTPQTIGRFQQVIETHDVRTNTVTRQAMADVAIDLRNSTIGDQDIPLILELRPSSMSGKLQRIHVRDSQLTPDGILELRRRLPETVIEE